MKPGDKVVCVQSQGDNIGLYHIKKGQIYTIYQIWECSCSLHLDIGLGSYPTHTSCFKCEGKSPDCSCYVPSKYFRPIQHNEAHEELINKKIVEEKLDVPTKIEEPQKQES